MFLTPKKGQSSLDECLREYTSPHMLPGVYCGTCNRKANRQSVTLLKTAPAILFIFIKRTQFDILTLQNTKFNDKIEFENKLDLTPYLKFNHTCHKPVNSQRKTM